MIETLRKYINLTRPVWVRGKRFRVPIWGGIEVPGIRSTRKTEIIARYARPGGVFIDVGVNLGQTLIDAKLNFPEIAYVGFEPNPICVAYVRQLVSANRFQDCALIPAGLSDRAGLVRLHSAPNQVVDHASTLIESLRPQKTAAQFVTTLVFDDVFREISAAPIGFVKIDVEGAELDVLKGMKSILAQDLPPIFCEVLPNAGGRDHTETESRRSELLALTRALGYSMYHVEDHATDGINLRQIDRFREGPYQRGLSWDYLFLAGEPS